MRGHDGRGERACRAGRVVLRGGARVAVARPRRGDRRVPAAPPVCARFVHPVLPDHRVGYDEQRVKPHRAGRTRHPRRTDLRHERVPGAERQTGI